MTIFNSPNNPTTPLSSVSGLTQSVSASTEPFVVVPSGGFVPPPIESKVLNAAIGNVPPVSQNTTPIFTKGPPLNGAPPNPAAARASWEYATDLRARLRVPDDYIKSLNPTAGPDDILRKNGGIIFPYTPSISFDRKAEYGGQNPLHSQYTQYYYKNSAVSPISVTAKFTVQNEYEGQIFVGIIHLLGSLTKMRWGEDPKAGSPPPVCRFDAYGDFMIQNVPVAVSSFKVELPDNIDYIAINRPSKPSQYGSNLVPTMSTISLELYVMYSRREMLDFNVPDWMSGALAGGGYL